MDLACSVHSLLYPLSSPPPPQDQHQSLFLHLLSSRFHQTFDRLLRRYLCVQSSSGFWVSLSLSYPSIYLFAGLFFSRFSEQNPASDKLCVSCQNLPMLLFYIVLINWSIITTRMTFCGISYFCCISVLLFLSLSLSLSEALSELGDIEFITNLVFYG